MFLVAVDGSELSMRGVRLAAYLMDPDHDRIKVVMVHMPVSASVAPANVEDSLKTGAGVKKKHDPPEKVLSAASKELAKCGCPSDKVQTDELYLEEEGTGGADTLLAVAELLTSLANRMLRRGAGMLVLGAAVVALWVLT